MCLSSPSTPDPAPVTPPTPPAPPTITPMLKIDTKQNTEGDMLAAMRRGKKRFQIPLTGGTGGASGMGIPV